jgi:hypothetical protein
VTVAAAPDELSGRAYLRLVALGALIGIPAALPEAPLIALGSVVGVAVSPLFRLGPRPAAVFTAAAAGLTRTALDRRLAQ